jgi:hypothetical protein
LYAKAFHGLGRWALLSSAQQTLPKVEEFPGSASMQAPSFQPGQAVEVHSLVKNLGLNSRRGRVESVLSSARTWTAVGCEMPRTGAAIDNERLVQHLTSGKLDFTATEVDRLGLSSLPYDSFVQCGDKYFRPSSENLFVVELPETDATQHSQTCADEYCFALLCDAQPQASS